MTAALALFLALLQAPPAAKADPPKPDAAPKTEAKADDAEKPEAKKKPLPVDAFRLRMVGPAIMSGRVVGLAVHPKDVNTYYVAVASGGVWKTTNNGTTWTPVFDDQGSFSIGYVALDPTDPETVWVGTGENNSQRSVGYGDGVYVSKNGGRTWKNVGLKTSEHIGKIVIDPQASSVYVAAQGPLWNSGGERGLYRTTDEGKTWERLLNIDEDTGVTDFVVVRRASVKGQVTSLAEPIPATRPGNPTQKINVVDVARYGSVIVAASYQRRRHVWTLVNGGPGSALHRSTDGGKTWTKLSAGLPSGELGRIGLAVAPTDPNTMYAVIESTPGQGGIFKSTDAGATWSKQNTYDEQGQYYSHVAVDPHDKDRIYVMNVMIQVSDDGGKTLSSLPSRDKHVDNHTIWVNPEEKTHVRVGCDGGLYESYDRGATWNFKANLPVTQFYDAAVDQNPKSGPFYHIYGGTQDNNTFGGPNKTRGYAGPMNSDFYTIQGGDGFHCAVDPTDPNTVYAEYQYAGLCRYDRRTGTRVDIQPLAAPGEKPLRWNWDSPLLLSPHDPKRLYFAANVVFKSDDRGDSWTPISGDLTRQLDRDKLKVFGKIQSPEAVSKHVSTSLYGNVVALAESPVKEGQLYAGTDDGLIQTTSDGGKTWTKVETFPGVPDRTYVSKLVASRHDPETVFAAFDNHKMGDFKPYLLKSTDAGKTWTSLAADLPERGTVYCVAEDHVNKELLFAGTEFGLFVTIDGGKTWTQMKGNFPTIQVKDLAIQRANDDLVVATFGRGFYVLDDYSPLRTLTAEAPEKPTVVGPKATLLYHPNSQFSGRGSQGTALFVAENGAYGPTFTVRHGESFKTKKEKRKEAERAARKAGKDIPVPTLEELRAEEEEEAPALVLEVSDKAGEVLRRVPVPYKPGVHRVTWDMHAAGVPSRRGRGGRGPLVTPGEYAVKLLKQDGVTLTPLSDAAAVTLTPDPLADLKPEDYAAIADFNAKMRALQKRLSATLAGAGDIATRLTALEAAIEGAEKVDAAALKLAKDATETVKLSQRALTGDPFAAGRNENSPTSIAERVRTAAGATDGAFARPTGTQRQAATDAAKLLEAELVKLRKVQDEVVPKLEAAAGTVAPGKLPPPAEGGAKKSGDKSP